MINITAIKLPESFSSYKNTKGGKAEFLEPISKINILVGSNNSGKSRFMRELLKLNELEIKQNTVELETTNSQIISIIEDVINALENTQIIQVGDQIEKDFLKSCLVDLNGMLNLGNDRFQPMRGAFNEILAQKPEFISIHFDKSINEYKMSQFKVRYQYSFYEYAKRIVTLLDNLPVSSSLDFPQQIYIPTLRGLRHLQSNVSDIYKHKTVEDYFPNQTSKNGKANSIEYVRPEIFTGLSLYTEIRDLHNGKYIEQKKLRDYETFISKELFEGKKIILTPNSKETTLYVKIGNENEQPIHHLGDGIQSAIILTFLPFVMQEQTFFFIEEPEMFLHPGLQRKLLNFYSSLEQHTFFLTTHSNHFLDITIDIKDVSIFTFRKILGESSEDELTPDFTIEAVDSGCESSLELLGVRNSSVFLVNATIWVEGITDRWYFRKMLESYMEFHDGMKLEEDTHYSFVEYGGANITHWSFLDSEDSPIEVERLCAKALVIIDGDGDGKEERKKKLKKRLKDNLIILPCREIENALPFDVIRQVVLEKEKDENLKIKDFSFDDYKDIYLGEFIETEMLENNPKRQGIYRMKPQEGKQITGTIKDKKGFCEKARPKIQYVDLPKPIKEVVKKIYDFICKQNSH